MKTNRLILNNADNYEYVTIVLDKRKFPILFENKVLELIGEGMPRSDAEFAVTNMQMEIELYYHIGHGLFGVESDAVESGAEIHSPYTTEPYYHWSEPIKH